MAKKDIAAHKKNWNVTRKDIEEVAIAGLSVLGKKHFLAAYACICPLEKSKATKVSFYNQASAWMNSDKVREYCQFRKKVEEGGAEAVADTEPLSDEEMINRLTRAIRAEKDGSKLVGIIQKFLDVRDKSLTTQEAEESRRVHLYLPWNSDCRQCSLFAEAKKKKQQEKEKEKTE